MSSDITQDNLIKLGFRKDIVFTGWTSIKINEEMSLNYLEGFSGIALGTSAIHHDFEHIRTTSDVIDLYLALTGKKLIPKI